MKDAKRETSTAHRYVLREYYVHILKL